MRYRFVALDVDGTLLDTAGELRPAVREAVREASAAGVLVTLATGRRFKAASRVASALGLELPLVLHGGTIIQDSLTAEVMYEDVVPAEPLRRTVATVRAADHQPVLYRSPATRDELLAGPPEWDNAATSRYLARQSVRRLPVEELVEAEHVISVGVFEDDDVLRPLWDTLREDADTSVLFWDPDPNYNDYPYLIDVVNVGCSKAKAVEHLAARYGIAMTEVLAIGDQVNDLDLISAAGLGVAMGNAIPAVKERADAVVGTNEQDGAAEALRRYVLDGERAG